MEITHEKKMPQKEGRKELNDINSLTLTFAIRDFSERLSDLEGQISKQISPTTQPLHALLIDFSKILFGGWPALCLLFLIIFYSPIKEALYVLPEKVRSANEIAMLGVSLKTTIKLEAEKIGESNLSKTIPSLSAAAIELLLQIPAKKYNLVYYKPSKNKAFKETFYFPLPEQMDIFEELEGNNLLIFKLNQSNTAEKTITVQEARKLFDDFREKNPGTADIENKRATWVLKSPISDELPFPNIIIYTTDLGSKAIDIIIKSVANELSVSQ